MLGEELARDKAPVPLLWSASNYNSITNNNNINNNTTTKDSNQIINSMEQAGSENNQRCTVEPTKLSISVQWELFLRLSFIYIKVEL